MLNVCKIMIPKIHIGTLILLAIFPSELLWPAQAALMGKRMNYDLLIAKMCESII